MIVYELSQQKYNKNSDNGPAQIFATVVE